MARQSAGVAHEGRDQRRRVGRRRVVERQRGVAAAPRVVEAVDADVAHDKPRSHHPVARGHDASFGGRLARLAVGVRQRRIGNGRCRHRDVAVQREILPHERDGVARRDDVVVLAVDREQRHGQRLVGRFEARLARERDDVRLGTALHHGDRGHRATSRRRRRGPSARRRRARGRDSARRGPRRARRPRTCPRRRRACDRRDSATPPRRSAPRRSPPRRRRATVRVSNQFQQRHGLAASFWRGSSTSAAAGDPPSRRCACRARTPPASACSRGTARAAARAASGTSLAARRRGSRGAARRAARCSEPPCHANFAPASKRPGAARGGAAAGRSP